MIGSDLEHHTRLDPQDMAVGQMVSEIVSAYLAHHTVSANDVPALIVTVREALLNAELPPSTLEVSAEPAVPIKKSVFPEYIICLEDGKKLKMLKRHLLTAYKMTPEDYRRKWRLPDNYPMTAPAYAERRSSLAKAIGLGQKRQTGAPEQMEVITGKRGSPRRTKAIHQE